MDCGECTLCCDLPEIKWLNKSANTLCNHYCSLNHLCKIHDNIKEECKNFECSYYQMEKCNIDLRPDKCGIMFEMVSDNIFLGTKHPNTKISIVGEKQIDVFLNQGFSIVISEKDKELKFYISNKHDNKEIYNQFKQILNKWQHQVT